MPIFGTQGPRRVVAGLVTTLLLNACGGGSASSSADIGTSEPAATPAPQISVLAGSIGGPGFLDGDASTARFRRPYPLGFDSQGNLVVNDSGSARTVSPQGTVTTIGPVNFSFATAAVAGDGAFWTAGYDVHRITSTTNVVVTPAGGGADGPFPLVAADDDGNGYVADSIRCVIWKVTPTLVESLLAGADGQCGMTDGSTGQALVGHISAITTDHHGTVYFVDQTWADGLMPLRTTLRKIAPDGTVTTIAGGDGIEARDGAAQDARFDSSTLAITADGLGNEWVLDRSNIRKVDAGANVTTLHLGGDPTALRNDGFNSSLRLAADKQGNLYVANTITSVVSVVRPGSNDATVLAGRPVDGSRKDGAAGDARFQSVAWAALDNNGDILVPSITTQGGFVIRRVKASGAVTSEFYPKTVGSPIGSDFSYDALHGSYSGYAYGSYPLTGYAYDAARGVHYLNTGSRCVTHTTDSAVSCDLTTAIWRITPDGTLAPFVGSAAQRYQPWVGPVLDASGNLYVGDANSLKKITPDGVVSTLVQSLVPGISWAAPVAGLATDPAGNIYVLCSDGVLRKVSPQGVVTALAGLQNDTGYFLQSYIDGVGSAAHFMSPGDGNYQMAVDGAGNVYLPSTSITSPDSYYQNFYPIAPPGTIRKVSPDGTVSTIAGKVDRFDGIIPGSLPGRLYAPGTLLWTRGGLVAGSGWSLLKITQ